MRASLLALAGGALTVLIACSLTWSAITVPMLDDVTGPVRTVALSGTDLAPLASASAWVALAGLLAVIATRSWGRVIVGAVVIAAGAVIIVSSASVGWQSSSNPLWTLAVTGGLGLSDDDVEARVNLRGGGIALGHPLGCSGARLVVSMLSVLEDTGGALGLATLCVGVGQGLAVVVERQVS